MILLSQELRPKAKAPASLRMAIIIAPRIRPVVSSAKRSEEHTSELQSLAYLVCRLLLEKKKYSTNKRGKLVSPSAAINVVGVVIFDGSTLLTSPEIDSAINRAGENLASSRST